MDTGNPESQEMPPAVLIEELEWQSLQINTVRAALKLQVWNRIASGPKTAGKIAEENGWDITGTQRLLDALCSMKLLDKDGYEYQLVPIAKAYLIAGTDSYMGDALLAVMNWEGNGELADAIRSGKRPIVNDWTSGGIAPFWPVKRPPVVSVLRRPLKAKMISGAY